MESFNRREHYWQILKQSNIFITGYCVFFSHPSWPLTLKTLIWQEAECRCSVYSPPSFSLNVSIWTRKGTPFSPPCLRIVNSVLIQWTLKNKTKKLKFHSNDSNRLMKHEEISIWTLVVVVVAVIPAGGPHVLWCYLDKYWGSFWRVPKELHSVELSRVSPGVGNPNWHGYICNGAVQTQRCPKWCSGY